jgi:hypothetical protein
VLGPDGAGGLVPTSFLYRGERHTLAEVLETWLAALPWWEDPAAVGNAPAQLRYWRVRTTRDGIFELTQLGTAWRLYKIYD